MEKIISHVDRKGFSDIDKQYELDQLLGIYLYITKIMFEIILELNRAMSLHLGTSSHSGRKLDARSPAPPIAFEKYYKYQCQKQQQ